MINNIVTALKEDRKGVITLCIESWNMEPRAVTHRYSCQETFLLKDFKRSNRC